jgi:hypothetical protein
MKSFREHLEYWRNEPEPRRQRRALFIAFSFTTLLFILWLASFRLSASLRVTPTVEMTTRPAVDGASPASGQVASPGIIARIKAGWETIVK